MTGLFGDQWASDARWRLLYCGIDLDPFLLPRRREQTLAQYGIPEKARVIGHLGRLTPAKNHEFLLDIAKEFKKRDENVWFLFMGDGELRASLRERLDREALNHVVMPGRMPEPEALAGLRSLDLLAFPSLREGLPQAVIEAQAAGIRCLCSENVTPEVAVNPGAVRFLPTHAGAARWADECREMLEMPRLDARSAVEAIRTSPFNISESVARLSDFYRGSV
jgi:glycosyltransferase involved in cell wall biosynthesis